MAQRIQLRRGTAAEWAAANPVLANGEPGVETDTGKQKFGNGAATWSALPYASAGPQGPAGVADDASVAALAADPESETAGVLSATYLDKASGLTKTEAGTTYALKSEAGSSLGKGKILVLGTSIAASVGATSTAFGYPARIGVNLATILGQTFEVVAGGVGGDRTTDMLVRLPALLATHKPTYVTIEVSVNDTWVTTPGGVQPASVTPTDLTTKNLRTMIALVKLAGAIPVLITSAPFDPVWLLATGNTAYDESSAAKGALNNTNAKALAIELGVPVVDVFEVTRDKPGIWADGLHPNNAGHDIWGKAVAQKIAQMVVAVTPPVLSDTFDRADSATTLGASWSAVSGTWGISSNKAYAVGNTAHALALQSLGGANQMATARAAALPAGGLAPLGLVVRSNLSGLDHYAADFTGTQVLLYKRVTGTRTLIKTITAASAIGDSLTLMVNGTHLGAYINGAFIGGVGDNQITTGTYAGLWNSATGSVASYWADFAATNDAGAIAKFASDSFNRADTNVIGTAETGQTWNAFYTGGVSVAFGIRSNMLAKTAGASGEDMLALNTGSGDVDLTVKIGVIDTAGGMGPAFRITNTTNYWCIDCNNGSNATLYKRVSGAFTSLGNVGIVGTGDVLRIVALGSTITAYVNGVQKLTVTDAAHSTATNHGVRITAASVSAGRIDYVEIA